MPEPENVPLNRVWVPCFTVRAPENLDGFREEVGRELIGRDIDDVGRTDERQRSGHVGVDRGASPGMPIACVENGPVFCANGTGVPFPHPSMQSPDCG